MSANEVIEKYFNSLIENGEIEIINFKSNDVIFREGALCKFACYIIEGVVEISTSSFNGTQEVISVVKEHEFFGQYVLFQQNSKYLGDVIAKGSVKLIRLSKNQLLGHLNKNIEFLEAYITFISKESFNIKQQVKLLSHKNAQDRVIFYLENYSKDNICNISSISSLAKQVNLPRETVSRMISKL